MVATMLLEEARFCLITGHKRSLGQSDIFTFLLSTGVGGACVAQGACMAGGCVWQGACVAEGGGMHGGAGVHGGSWRGVVCKAGKMATEVDVTRPTGMHSCLSGIF